VDAVKHMRNKNLVSWQHVTTLQQTATFTLLKKYVWCVLHFISYTRVHEFYVEYCIGLNTVHQAAIIFT